MKKYTEEDIKLALKESFERGQFNEAYFWNALRKKNG